MAKIRYDRLAVPEDANPLNVNALLNRKGLKRSYYQVRRFT